MVNMRTNYPCKFIFLTVTLPLPSRQTVIESATCGPNTFHQSPPTVVMLYVADKPQMCAVKHAVHVSHLQRPSAT